MLLIILIKLDIMLNLPIYLAIPKFRVGDYVRNADKRNILSKGYTSNCNRELFKGNEILNTQPPT